MEWFRSTNDARLVRDILRGRTDRYAALVERYLPVVEAVARAHVANATDAEDIAQNTFITGLQRLNTLREPAKFSHWIVRIARNKACDWLSGEARERERRAAAGELLYDGQESGDTPESRELHALLHRELDRLPAEYREVLALFYFADQGSREIGVMLELSHGAVRKRLQRGREVLGERMLRRLGGVTEGRDHRAKRAKAIYGMATATPLAWAGSAAATTGTGVGALLSGGAFALIAVTLVAVGAWQWREAPVAAVPPENAVEDVETLVGPTPQAGAQAIGAASKDTDSETAAKDMVRPSGDGVLFGTVYGLDDTPLANATVQLYLSSRNAGVPNPYFFPAQRSDAEGNFRFENLPHDNARYHLLALSPDGDLADEASDFIEPEFLLNQHFLELEPARPFAGQVIDASGAPVADAVVQTALYQEPDDTTTWRSAPQVPPVRTDAEGNFRFAHLEPGGWQVEVTAPGWSATLAPLVDGGETVVTMGPGYTLSGTFATESDGAPLANQPLWLGLPAVGFYARTTATDEEGHFRFPDLAVGTWSLRSMGGWFSEPMPVDIGEATNDVSVVLRGNPGGTVEGRVVMADGTTGASGVEVSTVPGVPGAEATTDEDGRFVLRHVPVMESVALRTVHKPYEPVMKLTLTPNEVRSDIVIALPQGERSVSGRVVDVQGEPMAGVEVEAFGRRNNIVPKTLVTGPDGAFAFHGIQTEDFFWIRGHRDGWISRDIQTEVDLNDIDGLELIMERPSALVGRVVDRQGKPVSGASVSARVQGIAQYRTRTNRSSTRGRFAFPRLVPGTYIIKAGRSDAARVELGAVTLVAGEETRDIVLTMGEGPSEEIAGRVVDAQGAPLPWAAITFEGTQNASRSGNATADDRGRFHLKNLEAGLYQLWFHKNDYARTVLPDVATGTHDAVATMFPPARVSGTVRYGASGAPVENYVVRAIAGERDYFSRNDLPGATNILDPSGKFALDKVNPGTVTVVAWAEGYEPAYEVLELGGGESREGITLYLEPEEAPRPRAAQGTTTLRGLIITPNKEPVAGAYVYLNYFPNPHERRGRALGRTGDDGRFEISAPLDAARLFAWHDDYSPAGTELKLIDKPVNETSLVMERGRTVQGVLTNSDGPLAKVRLSVGADVLGWRAYRNAMTDASGKFRIPHGPTGDTMIKVDYKNRSYNFPVPAGDRSLSIRLQTGTATLRGTVTLNGQPAYCVVRVTLPGGNVEERFSINTTEGGHFYIDSLPAGALSVEAICDGDARATFSVETRPDSATFVDIPVLSGEPEQE